MAETADMASEIDLEKAQEARRAAERVLEGTAGTDTVDLAAARAALQQALLRIRVAERRHREGPRHRAEHLDPPLPDRRLGVLPHLRRWRARVGELRIRKGGAEDVRDVAASSVGRTRWW